jgi:hypothetical protein
MAKTPEDTTRRRAGTIRAGSAAGARIGGRRPGGTNARFTEQLVALVEADRRERVMAIHEAHGISQAAVLRAVIDAGLAEVEMRIASGMLDPKKLA